MNTWFNTPERIALLNEVAASWVGTPFVANSRCKGTKGGVSCQMLAEQIYKEVGVPFDFQVPAGSMRWSGVSQDSLILKFISTHPELLEKHDDVAVAEVLAGDLLGFKVGGCLHHVGVALTDGKFIHCMRSVSTLICPLADPTFASRLVCLWRIKP